jgi:hypothetical protein
MKTAVYEGHQYYRRLPMLNLYSGLPSQPKKLILSPLELAVACNARRIIMHDAA